MNRKIISFFTSVLLLINIIPCLSVPALAMEVGITGYISVLSNNSIDNYVCLLKNNVLYLDAEDIGKITGYSVDIYNKDDNEWISYFKLNKLDFYTMVDIEPNGIATAMGRTYQIEVLNKDDTKFLPLTQMLYLLHAQWCIENDNLIVQPLPETIIDFLGANYGTILKNKVNQTDLLINGESELGHAFRSTLAAVFNDFDPTIFVIWWPDEGWIPVLNKEYKEALLQIAIDDKDFLDLYGQAEITKILDGTNFSQVKNSLDIVKNIIDVPENFIDGKAGIEECNKWISDLSKKSKLMKFGKYNDFPDYLPDNISYIVPADISALSKELENITDVLDLVNIFLEVNEVQNRSKKWGEDFINQIYVLTNFNDTGYNTNITNRVKNIASGLIDEYKNPIEAASDEAVLKSVSYFLSRCFDESLFGKYFAIFNAGLSIAKINENIKDSIDVADLSYMVDCLVKIEHIALEEMKRSYSITADMTEDDLIRLRNCVMLLLRTNLRNKTFIYYMNSMINDDIHWQENVQAKIIQKQIFNDYALLCQLMETEPYDKLILLSSFDNIYSDEFGMLREPITTDIFHEGDLPTVDYNNLSEQVVNNGGLAVQYNNTYYYWIFSGFGNDTMYTLIREEEGITEELYTCKFQSNIFLLDNTVFINQHGNNYSDVWTLKINLLGEKDILEGVSVIGVDLYTNKLFMECPYDSAIRKKGYYIYDIFNDVLTRVNAVSENVRCLAISNGSVYFIENTKDNKSIMLSLYDLKNNEFRVISIVTDRYTYGPYPVCNIYYIQETNSGIYYSYGYSDGTGHYFQGGNLAYVDKDSYSTKIIADMYDTPNSNGPQFYVFQQDGIEKVLYYNAKKNSVCVMNVETGETVISDMLLGTLQTPIYEYENEIVRYWMYPSEDGRIIEILPAMQFKKDDIYVYVENISYTGQSVFYELDYQRDNPNPTSWRDYTETFKREAYVYNIETKENRILCSTDSNGTFSNIHINE